MKKNNFALQIVAFGLIILSFIACDKDFANLESDIVNKENATNFSIKDSTFQVITYTEALGPVQTNELGLNTLGLYDDTYGRTTSSFVTQVTTSTFNPVFGEEVQIDSVVLKIPYFSVSTEVEEDGNVLYEIDSVIGRQPIKLSLFESDYFIRDFDPNGDFNDSQSYFSDKSLSPTESISEASLEYEELIFLTAPETSHLGNNIIEISDKGFVLTEPDNADDDDNDPQILFREPPGIRILLEPAYWQTKIIDQEGESVLSSASDLAEYFRGLYFKAEAIANDGSFLILSTGSQTSHVTIYYTRLTTSSTDDPAAREQSTFQLRFGAERINFMDNNFTTPINNGDAVNGDERIYLKGGEGALAKIKLFNGDDVDDLPEMNAFETFKNTYVETDSDGNFVRSKRLINEANLIFYVDRTALDLLMADPKDEPNRVYLYDIDNKTRLVDYFLDLQNLSIPTLSIINHLGPLQRVDNESDGDGVRYKLKITEHITNLLVRDSTNVELGLAVSLNVNIEQLLLQRKVQNIDDLDAAVPASSVVTPRGTILHGNNTTEESKKVYLEIYYTEPNN